MGGSLLYSGQSGRWHDRRTSVSGASLDPRANRSLSSRMRPHYRDGTRSRSGRDLGCRDGIRWGRSALSPALTRVTGRGENPGTGLGRDTLFHRENPGEIGPLPGYRARGEQWDGTANRDGTQNERVLNRRAQRSQSLDAQISSLCPPRPPVQSIDAELALIPALSRITGRGGTVEREASCSRP